MADRNNHRIQVFTAEGKFLKMFGRRGEGRGELKNPMGIAIDSGDMVYVSERNNHRVSVFTSVGEYMKSFGSRGEGPGQFLEPCGVAVDKTGLVYVCDFSKQPCSNILICVSTALHMFVTATTITSPATTVPTIV